MAPADIPAAATVAASDGMYPTAYRPAAKRSTVRVAQLAHPLCGRCAGRRHTKAVDRSAAHRPGSLQERVLRVEARAPRATNDEIAKAVGCHPDTVRKYRRFHPRAGAPTNAVRHAAATRQAQLPTLRGSPTPDRVLGLLSDHQINQSAAATAADAGPATGGFGITAGDHQVAVVHSPSGWVCDPDIPSEAPSAPHRQPLASALLGAAVAHSLNVGMIRPQEDHMAALDAHIAALRRGKTTDATASGANPLAFAAAALYTLDQVTIYCTSARQAADTEGVPLARLLPEGLIVNDLRCTTASGDDEALIGLALQTVGQSESLVGERTPWELLVSDTVTHSPARIAAATGLGSVVGTGPEVFAELHDTRVIAGGDNTTLTGLAVLSAAHRDPPPNRGHSSDGCVTTSIGPRICPPSPARTTLSHALSLAFLTQRSTTPPTRSSRCVWSRCWPRRPRRRSGLVCSIFIPGLSKLTKTCLPPSRTSLHWRRRSRI